MAEGWFFPCGAGEQSRWPLGLRTVSLRISLCQASSQPPVSKASDGCRREEPPAPWSSLCLADLTWKQSLAHSGCLATVCWVTWCDNGSPGRRNRCWQARAHHRHTLTPTQWFSYLLTPVRTESFPHESCKVFVRDLEYPSFCPHPAPAQLGLLLAQLEVDRT